MNYCPFSRTPETGLGECVPGCALRIDGTCAIAIIANNISSYVRHCIVCHQPLGPMDVTAFCSESCRHEYILSEREEERKLKQEFEIVETIEEPESRNEEEATQESV